MHGDRGQKVKGHVVTKTVTVALLLVNAGIPYTYMPAWVCMSIRLPMFSSYMSVVIE